jgi:EAL domain-containing protein (putative c-di-GMP-specific phosphodiesterase class I)/FixJ family two-component response regulator
MTAMSDTHPAAAPAVRSLLIVDDSAVQRDHAAKLSRARGVEHVHEACHGADALVQLERLVGADQAPDVLLIDLEMPVMDGIQLIQQLCTRGVEIPFIVASTREQALLEGVVTMAHAMGRPSTSSLRKPYDQAALDKALSHCARAAKPRIAPAAPPEKGSPIVAARLTQALAAGKVVPHFQPKVDLRTALPHGVEALARWHDPVLGQVRPDIFVAAAERHGLIQPLTLTILDQSLAQAARWRSRGLDLHLAVNLSPLLLSQPALVDELGNCLARHGARPEQVTLEITEGSVVAYEGLALGTLARLRMQGYGLSIDDFGTGFSSMQQLARIPFTQLKVDRSFVNGAHTNEHLRVMLQSAIELARRLSIVSVAEGVETMDDWALLQRLGCTLAQGWLVAKAMPGDEIPGWLKQHAQRLGQLRAPRLAETDPSIGTPIGA